MTEPFAWRFRGGRAIQLHVHHRLADHDVDLGPSPIDKPPTRNPFVEVVDLAEHGTAASRAGLDDFIAAGRSIGELLATAGHSLAAQNTRSSDCPGVSTVRYLTYPVRTSRT